MMNMDMSTGATMQTEIDFEVTEDIDEVHYVNAVITDKFVYDVAGDTVERNIDVDVDGEIEVQFSIIFQEVATGVHVYLEYRPIVDAISAQEPMVATTMGWVGLDDTWMLFKADDSLANVVELAIVKDMLVSALFSEIGEMFFYDFQENTLEPEIGFDLNQYGVDLGLLVDKIIEEDWTTVETMLQGINVEGIVWHADAMYVEMQL